MTSYKKGVAAVKTLRGVGTILIMGLLLLGGIATEAKALIFDLNGILGHSGLIPSASWGTITINSSVSTPGGVDVAIDLNSAPSQTFKVLSLYLNTTAQYGGYNTVPSRVGVHQNFNAIDAGSYHAGHFDLKLPDGGILGWEPLTTTITWNMGPISPATFDMTDTSGIVYAAVHIGNCDTNATCDQNGGSVWTGAGSSQGSHHPPASLSAPEPFVLLWLAFLGLGIWKLVRQVA
jgi:hypothetical protein